MYKASSMCSRHESLRQWKSRENIQSFESTQTKSLAIVNLFYFYKKRHKNASIYHSRARLLWWDFLTPCYKKVLTLLHFIFRKKWLCVNCLHWTNVCSLLSIIKIKTFSYHYKSCITNASTVIFTDNSNLDSAKEHTFKE